MPRLDGKRSPAEFGDDISGQFDGFGVPSTQKKTPPNRSEPIRASLIETSGCIDPVSQPAYLRSLNTSEDNDPLV